MGGILQPVHRNLSGIRIPPPWQQESQLGIPVATQPSPGGRVGLVDGLLGCLTLTARSTSLSACLARFGGWGTLFQGDCNKFFQRGPLGSTILRKSSIFERVARRSKVSSQVPKSVRAHNVGQGLYLWKACAARIWGRGTAAT